MVEYNDDYSMAIFNGKNYKKVKDGYRADDFTYLKDDIWVYYNGNIPPHKIVQTVKEMITDINDLILIDKNNTKHKIQKICSVCGKSYVGTKNRKFCSTQCRYQSYKTKKTCICEICGKTFEHTATHYTVHYCPECKDKQKINKEPYDKEKIINLLDIYGDNFNKMLELKYKEISLINNVLIDNNKISFLEETQDSTNLLKQQIKKIEEEIKEKIKVRNKINDALSQYLNNIEFTVITLKYQYKKKCKEIAKELNISERQTFNIEYSAFAKIEKYILINFI